MQRIDILQEFDSNHLAIDNWQLTSMALNRGQASQEIYLNDTELKSRVQNIKLSNR